MSRFASDVPRSCDGNCRWKAIARGCASLARPHARYSVARLRRCGDRGRRSAECPRVPRRNPLESARTMPRFDAANSVCRVYPRRAGLLGAVGHDLEVGVADYAIEVAPSGQRVDASFAAASLYVIDAVDGGRLRPGTLSAADKATINRHIAHDVLHASRYPTIAFHSTAVEARAGHHQ